MSMTQKDWMVKELARTMGFSQEIVDRVIDHQFNEFLNATKTCNTLEISGFGKFYFKEKTMQKKIEKMDGQIRSFRMKIAENPESKMINWWNNTIDEMLIRKQMFINRLNRNNENVVDADLRGLEKSSTSRIKIEGDDR